MGKIGVADGTGYTEAGSQSKAIRQTDLTIKNNTWCAEELKARFGKHLINRAKIRNYLPHGVNKKIICARGEECLASEIITDLWGYGVSDMKVIHLLRLQRGGGGVKIRPKCECSKGGCVNLVQ